MLGIVAAALAAALLCTSGPAEAASTGTKMLRMQGNSAGTARGDYVSDTGGQNDPYHFWVEVPAGVSSLQIDIFDADFGAGGTAEGDADRDRLRNGATGRTVTYRLFQPDTTEITTGSTPALKFAFGTRNAPANSNGAWLNWYTRSNPPAGHWEIQVSINAGDDVNAFGIRAHDGTPGAGGTELAIYADSEFEIGVNPPASGTRSSTFTMYPYVTSGCTANHQDFDFDSDTDTVVGTNQSVTYTNRDATWTSTIANAQLSADDVWVNVTLPDVGAVRPAGTINSRTGMGLWTADYTINETAGPAANFAELIVSADGSTTPPVTTTPNPPTNTFRVYFPDDAGNIPKKPYLRQGVVYRSGANPPAIGQATIYGVSVSFINETAQAVTFSNAASHWIQARVPTGVGATYYTGGTGVAQVTQGTINASPAAGGTGNFRWDPGTVAAGATVDLYYEISVTPVAGSTTFSITGDGNGNNVNNNTLGTRADFVDNTGNTTQPRATYGFGGLCPLQIKIGTSVATPVTVAWQNVKRTSAGVDVRWATDTEVGNAGFDIFGLSGGAWIKLNKRMIPSHRSSGTRKQKYAVSLVAPSDVSQIRLEDISTRGVRASHSVVAVGGESGVDLSPPAINWATQAPIGGSRSVASVQSKAYVDVNADGLWRVRVADAAAAGIDLSSMKTAQVALVGSEGPVPLRVINAAGGVLGSSAEIEFYGRARESVYGHTNTYTLSMDPVNARRMLEANGANLPWTKQTDWYWAKTKIARQVQYSFASPAASPWIDSELFAPGASAETTYNLVVDSAYTLDNATIGVNVSGQDDFPDRDDDHRLRIDANGVFVNQVDFPGIREEKMRFPVQPGQLIDGNNAIRLSLPADQGVAFDQVDINSVDVLFQRRFVARNGELDASLAPIGDSVNPSTGVLFRDDFGDSPEACAMADCTAVTVTGATATSQAFAINGGQAVHFVDAVSANGSLRVVTPNDGDWRLVVSDPANAPVATVRPVPVPVDVSGQQPQLVIVAHPNFVDALAPFVTAKANAGISARVVSADAVYAKYSGGRHDPEAIRRMFADAYAGGTRYGLLVGGDSYDYENVLGLGSVSYVPTVYTRTSEVMQWSPSDPLLGDINGDGLPEVAIGRWPVRNQDELARAMQRTLDYAARATSHDAVLSAGYNCEGGSCTTPLPIDFVSTNGAISDVVAGHGWTVRRIEADNPGSGGPITSQLIAAINAGPSLTSYVGHSSPNSWSYPYLLSSNDVVTALTNSSRPTVVAQWGCWTTYFVDPTTNSIGQSFLFDGTGGAAAVIGATGLVDIGQNDPFALAFTQRATAGVRLGDALDQTRRQFAGDSPKRLDMINGVTLLGDPTLILH